MKYLLLWSNKDGNYWFETDDIKELKSPLAQIYTLHYKRQNKTSLPKVFHGKAQQVTSFTKMIDGKEVYDKFQIEDIKSQETPSQKS